MRSALVLLGVLVIASEARAEPPTLEEAVVEHVQRIWASDPSRRDDAFVKMGGSSVASKAFLYCFATDHVDLGDHAYLAETLRYFDTGRRNSFNRKSQAAGVSWNLRYVLGGRPANFRRELGETDARWALVLFGGNDAQNQNERIYLERLVYLVEAMVEMGVVPILGSALPRRSRSKNRWIHRFNSITAAVAKHWALPFVDYHEALSELPRQGLAHDGVHPNVLPPGGYKRSCRLTEKGLRYGNNLRNLLTLQMLDALRRSLQPPPPETHLPNDLASAEALADAASGSDVSADAETARDPFPISDLVDKASLPEAARYPRACGPIRSGTRHYRVPLRLDERARLRASALDLDGGRPRIFLVRHDAEGSRCVRRRTQTLEVDVPAGMWDLRVEVPGRTMADGRMLVLIAREPR